MNDIGTDKISDLDHILYIFPHASPVSTNGGPSDAQQKVNCPFFYMIDCNFGVMKTASVPHTQIPSFKYMKVAIDNNPLHQCRAPSFSKSPQLS